ncbi:MAG: ABC transporter permease [Chloroflexi bacterium]|nr:ABC transporter permease [Chloroflexota bacterium]
MTPEPIETRVPAFATRNPRPGSRIHELGTPNSEPRTRNAHRGQAGGIAGGAILLLVALAVSVGPLLDPGNPNEVDLATGLRGPGPDHWLGSDQLGRDVMLRLLYGGRSALSLAVPAALAVTGIGVALGLLSGYFGGWLDLLVAGLLNALLALPGLILSLAVLALLGPGRLSLLAALVAAGWIGLARLSRAAVLVLREAGYVEAARAVGAPDTRILLHHILPNTLGLVAVLAALELGSMLLAMAALSFLGLGEQPPAADWGVMLNDGRPYFRTYPHLMLLPGLCIFLVALGANLLGDALRDILDPRRR